MKQEKRKGYIVYSLITALLEEAALVAVVLWLLPRFGINLPLWGLILLVVALGAYDYITYRLGKKALVKKPVMIPPEVGNRCRATTPLAPEGYVQIKGELWKASSTGPMVLEGQEVIIVGIKGLMLFVSTLGNNNHEDKAATLHS